MGDTLSERSRHILEAIIEDYIATAEPVGSRTITRRHGMSLSPATVRNVMADLEEMGLLASPHTSAGRIPTEKAYRLYVDSLLEVRGIAPEERDMLGRQCSVSGRDVQSVLKETSRMLSFLSRYTGVVVAPRFTTNLFRQIEFVKLGGQRVLAIMVSRNGIVQNKIIESDEELGTEDLVRMANCLNDLLSGLTIAEVRTRIKEEMLTEKARYDAMLSRALRLSQQTFGGDEAESAGGLFIEGQANILSQPEFSDVDRMRDVFRAFEEKGQLLELLDRCVSAEGVQIFIGAETHLHQMSGMSLITSTYMTGRDTVGVLGVIGPTRMGYGKVIPIVDYTAKLVSRLLEME